MATPTNPSTYLGQFSSFLSLYTHRASNNITTAGKGSYTAAVNNILVTFIVPTQPSDILSTIVQDFSNQYAQITNFVQANEAITISNTTLMSKMTNMMTRLQDLQVKLYQTASKKEHNGSIKLWKDCWTHGRCKHDS